MNAFASLPAFARSSQALVASLCLLQVFLAAYAVTAGDIWQAALRLAAAAAVFVAASRMRPGFSAAVACIVWLPLIVWSALLDEATVYRLRSLADLGALAAVWLLSVYVTRATSLWHQGRALEAARQEGLDGIDPELGVYRERLLRISLETELARARRFGHSFAFVLIGARPVDRDARRRDAQNWRASHVATARLLLRTRLLVDRVFSYGPSGFAMILPESGPQEVVGLIRRLKRLAGRFTPPEGQPGGPFPVAFGATFYPEAATSVEALLARAEIALRMATRSGGRFHLDGAETQEIEPPEALRAPQEAEAEPPALEAGGESPDAPAAGSVEAPGVAATDQEPETDTQAADEPVSVASSAEMPESLRAAVEGLLKDLDDAQAVMRSLRDMTPPSRG